MPTKILQIVDKIIKTDSTLTQECMAADAKAVGDWIYANELRVDDVESNVSILVDEDENKSVRAIANEEVEAKTGVIPVLPVTTDITLVEVNWTGDASPYSQVVEISSATATSKVDLQPTDAQIAELQNADIALMAENIDGVITVYSFGSKLSADMTMQVILT